MTDREFKRLSRSQLIDIIYQLQLKQEEMNAENQRLSGELADKRISSRLEDIMEARQIYQYRAGDTPLPVCEDSEKFFLSAAAPILSEGDVLGCVLFVGAEGQNLTGEVEYKLLQTISGFLGRHMES